MIIVADASVLVAQLLRRDGYSSPTLDSMSSSLQSSGMKPCTKSHGGSLSSSVRGD